MNIKVLLTGANGQVAQELQRTKPANMELIGFSHQQLDITKNEEVQAAVNQHKPNCIINAAAFNNVDLAETAIELATAVNASGPQNLAQAAKKNNAQFIHISTDYVFAGTQGHPYLPTDQTHPLGVYGQSKLKGEQLALEQGPAQTLIFRTSWVYSKFAKNFVKSMLHFFKDHAEISMVADQVGAPTWAKNLALTIWTGVKKPELQGIYHYADAGVASKYDLAMAILEEAMALKLLTQRVTIKPIKSADFKTAAVRPLYSVLDSTKTWEDFAVTPMYWREALREMLKELE